MSNSLQQGILRLIYSAVTGEDVTLPKGFALEQAMPWVKRHQIGNLVFYGAANYGIDPKLPVMQELRVITYKSILVDDRQNKALRQLMNAFEANGICYMPVKGILMKQLYPKTDMRVMGDADILIRMDQYDRIRPIVEQLGYQEKLESDHEFVWQKPALYLELHKRLIPSYNYDYAAYYGDGWQLGHPVADNSCRFTMTDEDHMVYLFAHFAKHYRDGGIGIRHMLDLYMYRKAKPDMNAAYIYGELEKLRLQVFYENIFRTLDVWFANGQADAITEMITKFVFASGVYGATDAHHIAQGIRDKAEEGGTSKQVRTRAWLRMAFLPYEFMQEKYPILKKVPILLPIMWVVRWVRALFTEPQVIFQQSQLIKLLREDKLDAWETHMQAVGLAFCFEEKKS